MRKRGDLMSLDGNVSNFLMLRFLDFFPAFSQIVAVIQYAVCLK